MFLILSIISYKVFTNDPPVILAYNKDGGIAGSLVDAVKNAKSATIIRPTSSSITIRVSSLDSSFCDLELDQVYVYPNTTDLEKVYGLNGTDGISITEFNADSIESACDAIVNGTGLIIAAEHYPEFPKVGYSNPFTPGVWNCFFFIIFCLSFIIWSMIHYANIDVQTRFAKKLY